MPKPHSASQNATDPQSSSSILNNAVSSSSKGHHKSKSSTSNAPILGMSVSHNSSFIPLVIGNAGKGVSKNAKKADSLDHQVDSLKEVISRLQLDSALLVKDTIELHKQLDAKQTKIEELLKANNELRGRVDTLQSKQTPITPIAALTSPSGCAVLIVFIIALTIIAVKKGVSISKGNTSISVGDNKK